MNHLLLSLVVVAICSTSAHQNEPRYAPGVPPPQQQQYQQPPPPQQQQQQQQYQQQGQQQQQYQQQGQQQQQYQQPPQGQQQQYQQVNQMNQQQPPVQGHGHGHGHDDTLRFSSDVHNAEHVMEHLENVIEKPKDQMTEEELEFHYFKMHDYDDNNKLDGVEIGKALTHYHADDGPKMPAMSDEDIMRTVDAILEEDDLDGDGYVEYVEFVTAQRRARHQGKEKESSLPIQGGNEHLLSVPVEGETDRPLSAPTEGEADRPLPAPIEGEADRPLSAPTEGETDRPLSGSIEGEAERPLSAPEKPDQGQQQQQEQERADQLDKVVPPP